MRSDDLFELVDGRGPCPLFLPQHILDAINLCLLTREAHKAGDAEFRDTEIARLDLADMILARAEEAGIQVCR